MFTYSQGKLYAQGICFTIPEKFSINSEPAITGEDLIEFVSPDESYSVMFSIEHDCQGTRFELEKFLSDDAGGIALQDIQAVTMDELHGHQLLFKGGCGEQYQLRLSLSNCSEFVIHIGSKFLSSIEGIVSSKEIQNILKSICQN